MNVDGVALGFLVESCGRKAAYVIVSRTQALSARVFVTDRTRPSYLSQRRYCGARRGIGGSRLSDTTMYSDRMQNIPLSVSLTQV